MVSQLLFGETVTADLKREKNSFLPVRNDWDGYEAWVDRKTIGVITSEEYQRLRGSGIRIVRGYMHTTLHPLTGAVMLISAGSVLYSYWGMKTRELKSNSQLNRTGNLSPADFIALCMLWLETPYLWGGRGCFGLDCSGFTQNIFRQMNIQLPRDAGQQSKTGTPIPDPGKSAIGDLAFFTKNERIVHTGIVMDNNRIIHASGKVRIDTLDEKGILSHDTKKHSHTLSGIRRYDLALTFNSQ
jgi:cell wall-associated NlpC family hydrolase